MSWNNRRYITHPKWSDNRRCERYDRKTSKQSELASREKDKTNHKYFSNKPSYCTYFSPSPSYLHQSNLPTSFPSQVRRSGNEPPQKRIKLERKEEKKDGLSKSWFVAVDWKKLNEGRSEDEAETCNVCLDDFDKSQPAYKLSKCKGSHYFHKPCVSRWLKEKKACPVCKSKYGILIGNQPYGQFTSVVYKESLPEYSSCGTIEMTWNLPGGIQGKGHPPPGMHYSGTYRNGYLPDNEEGRQVLELFKIAWERKLVFTIGTSVTRNVDNVIIWNGIHVKTSQYGGFQNYGFPDPTYLTRVKEEFKQKGIP